MTRTVRSLSGLLLFAAVLTSSRTVVGDDARFQAVEYVRRTIYRSPQSPGYACWVGAWSMPDGSLMTCFTQATGPIGGRPTGPADALRRLNWPPEGHPGYDMTGLDLRNVHLRSTLSNSRPFPSGCDC